MKSVRAQARRIVNRYRQAGRPLDGAPPVERPAEDGLADPKSLWTGYLQWLGFANAGMLNRGNVAAFDYVLRHLSGDSPIVEVGSFCGLSTNVITYFKEQHAVKNRLITCDKWLFEGAQSGQPVGASRFLSHGEYREFVRDSYVRNIKTFARYDLPYTVELLSDEFFDAWARGERRVDVLGREVVLGGPISFGYIDGDHRYEFARRDFENTDRYLEPGGWILFDDSADGSGWEVCRVVAEVKASGRYAVVAHNPNYLFRKL